MTLRSIALTTAAISLLMFSAAGAQVPAPVNAHGACKADVQKLCAGIEHGGGRIMQCMKAHVDEISRDCRSAMAAHLAAKRAALEAAPPPQSPPR